MPSPELKQAQNAQFLNDNPSVKIDTESSMSYETSINEKIQSNMASDDFRISLSAKSFDNSKNTLVIDYVEGKNFSKQWPQFKQTAKNLGFEKIQLLDRYHNREGKRDKDYWGEKGFKPVENEYYKGLKELSLNEEAEPVAPTPSIPEIAKNSNYDTHDIDYYIKRTRYRKEFIKRLYKNNPSINPQELIEKYGVNNVYESLMKGLKEQYPSSTEFDIAMSFVKDNVGPVEKSSYRRGIKFKNLGEESEKALHTKVDFTKKNLSKVNLDLELADIENTRKEMASAIRKMKDASLGKPIETAAIAKTVAESGVDIKKVAKVVSKFAGTGKYK